MQLPNFYYFATQVIEMTQKKKKGNAQ